MAPRRVITVFGVALVALAALRAAPVHAATLPCGLPSDGPVWIEFGDGSVGFRFQLFGKPGVVVATNGVPGPAQLRAQGAKTVFWVMHVWSYTGTPKAPADPATIPAAADEIVQKAIASSGCDTPVIALNELFGAYRASPWPEGTAQYRANMLALLQALAARGALPFLLVPAQPAGPRAAFLDGDTRVWWLQVAQVAHIVREMHFSGRYIYQRGPIVGPRLRRVAMRTSLEAFTRIGIPADRLSLMLGFQSGPGAVGGRQNLSRTAWLDVVKQETLSAETVARELGISTVWVWGWGTFGPATTDPDKPAAACVHLWALDPALCDGPGVAGGAFNASRTLGQIAFPATVQCTTTLGPIKTADVEATSAALAGNERLALTALLSRLVYRRAGALARPEDIALARSSVIARGFGGDRTAYDAAIAALGLDDASARSILGDQLARQRFGALLAIREPGTPPAAELVRRQRDALRRMVCRRDELPVPQDFDWAGQLPSLRVPPASVSIRAERTAGSRVVLFGRVTNPLAAEAVTVFARSPRGRHYAAVGNVRLRAGGGWRLTVTPRAATYYRALALRAVSSAVFVRPHAAH
jgi:hypothetical protein